MLAKMNARACVLMTATVSLHCKHSTVQECYLYRLVSGVKQVERGNGFSYLVKVPKGTYVSHHKNSGNGCLSWLGYFWRDCILCNLEKKKELLMYR
ncbi:LOW QUALITY PROTEIN: hypothetical protein RJ641_024503 [Dillenia turbinata]|uniref:Uncharacterized protein n=1 Tax=Dillenia turbinata TaxID=194707 RepID=A0AAN8W7P5_9MAGN